MTDALSAFRGRADALRAEMLSDPEGLKSRTDEQLVAEHGREWFDAHREEIEAEWRSVRDLFGF